MKSNVDSDTIAPNLLTQPSPRGVKRARSPEADEGARTLETRAGTYLTG